MQKQVAAYDLAQPWAQTGGGSLRSPCLQSFNTEVTEMLRALRVEGLMVAEYTEPLPRDDLLFRT